MKYIYRIASLLLVVCVIFVSASCSFDAGDLASDETTKLTVNHTIQGTEDNNDADDIATSATTTTTTTTALLKTPAELQALIDKQEVKVIATKYIVQDAKYKALYPDLLSATVQNNSKSDIRNAVVAYVAWDSNNLPVKIIGQYDYSDGSYVKQCNFSDINLVPGKSVGGDKGMPISDDCSNIDTFKAIVVSYEGFDGETWENPYYSEWIALYSGEKLPS